MYSPEIFNAKILFISSHLIKVEKCGMIQKPLLLESWKSQACPYAYFSSIFVHKFKRRSLKIDLIAHFAEIYKFFRRSSYCRNFSQTILRHTIFEFSLLSILKVKKMTVTASGSNFLWSQKRLSQYSCKGIILMPDPRPTRKQMLSHVRKAYALPLQKFP